MRGGDRTKADFLDQSKALKTLRVLSLRLRSEGEDLTGARTCIAGGGGEQVGATAKIKAKPPVKTLPVEAPATARSSEKDDEERYEEESEYSYLSSEEPEAETWQEAVESKGRAAQVERWPYRSKEEKKVEKKRKAPKEDRGSAHSSKAKKKDQARVDAEEDEAELSTSRCSGRSTIPVYESIAKRVCSNSLSSRRRRSLPCFLKVSDGDNEEYLSGMGRRGFALPSRRPRVAYADSLSWGRRSCGVERHRHWRRSRGLCCLSCVEPLQVKLIGASNVEATRRFFKLGSIQGQILHPRQLRSSVLWAAAEKAGCQVVERDRGDQRRGSHPLAKGVQPRRKAQEEGQESGGTGRGSCGGFEARRYRRVVRRPLKRFEGEVG